MLLGRVVSAILVDLASAQHTANEYAKQLSQKYKPDAQNPDNLSAFRLPGGLLNDIELDLKFAIRELEEVPGKAEPDRERNVFGPYAQQSARKAIDLLSTAIEREKSEAEIEDTKSWDLVVRNLRSKQFEIYLTRVISDGLERKRDQIMPAGPGTLNTQRLQNALDHVLNSKLLNHQELTQILDPNTSHGQQIRQSFQEALPTFVSEEALECLLSAPTPDMVPSVDVILNPDDLKELPAAALSSIRIKASVSSYRWVVSDTKATLNEV
jgi:hypothetical protein